MSVFARRHRGAGYVRRVPGCPVAGQPREKAAASSSSGLLVRCPLAARGHDPVTTIQREALSKPWLVRAMSRGTRLSVGYDPAVPDPHSFQRCNTA